MGKSLLLEKQIKNQILSWLRTQGVFAWQNDSVGIWDAKRGVYRKQRGPYHLRGVSDILGIWQGKFLAIEVKTKTGRVSPEQAAYLDTVNAKGGIGLVARSLDEVIFKLGNMR